MEIEYSTPPIDGKIPANISFRVELNGLGHRVKVETWITDQDSRAQCRIATVAAAQALLEQVLQDLRAAPGR